jgi:N-methylhydantoinase A
MQYRVGIDIGGTFTDFVAFDEANRQLKAWKNLSTPRDPIEGVMTGLKAFGGTDEIGSIRLGTTVATNAQCVRGKRTDRAFRRRYREA